jgi:hypothetical protein
MARVRTSAQRAFERELITSEAMAVELRFAGRAAPVSGRSRNISVSGIFVEVADPVAVGAEVELLVGGREGGLRAVARVVRTLPGVGFGAQFLDDDRMSRSDVVAFMKRVKKP